MQKFQNMKVLTSYHCEYFTYIRNVSGLPNLEKLSFENCKNLITIDNSTIRHQSKLEILNADGCSNLDVGVSSFPKLLCKMKNIEYISLYNTSIRELPSSFQNLSKLYQLSLRDCCNLFDECLPIFLKCCVNMVTLDLSNNNFKILPECLNECHLVWVLNLDRCKSVEEIRGIPPNLERLSAIECKSLSSSSRRMLLSQAGRTCFSFSNGTDGILLANICKNGII
ncbi:disease resistance protein (TIR-NBS-LRR class) [Medicago truncatula]|uniref:Disease resistance protein (TIR-NBS-LRR class) n=1 Tax=Medicago truncatula TaxID=3880 RepID=G7LCT9_MEDTR|nr:disease resistance protein (TIR-NBS-LRR class) [Medicago truncatula]